MQHLKKIAKKKSVIGLCSVLAVTGTVYGVEFAKPAEPTRYVLAQATHGTLVVSLSGSGQVSGLNQVDVKPSVSGAVIKVLVKPGEEVTAGTPLFEIDRKTAVRAVRDAAQTVTDAELSLASAQLSLKKLKQPADAIALLQAQNALAQAQRNLQSLRDAPDPLDVKAAEQDLKALEENVKLSEDGTTPHVVRNAYDNAVPVLKTTIQVLQQALTDADTILGIDNTYLNDTYERLLSILDASKLSAAERAYPPAMQTVALLKARTDTLKTVGASTVDIDQALAEAQAGLGDVVFLMERVQDVLANTLASATFSQSSLESLRNTIQSDRTNVTSKLATLTTQVQAIENAKISYASSVIAVEKSRVALEKLKQGTDVKDLATAEERVRELEASLANVQAGPDAIDIAVSENALAQRRSAVASARNRLADAQDALNDYTVRAPFDGVVALLDAKEADQASPSTVLATLLTKAKIAELALNEVDAAKVRPGQKATLTFDAVPDLSIAGTVSEVDAIGTVAQGVVNYGIKIAFLTQDERVKTGMSVAASLVTDIQQDAVLVPNSALQTQGDFATVKVLKNATATTAQSEQGVTSDTPPETRQVVTGIANDAQTVIAEGITEGEYVVTRTMDPTTTAVSSVKKTTAATSVRIPGMGGGFGGGR